MINPSREIPKRNPDVLSKAAAESRMLLDLSSGDYFELDPVAHHIWEAMDGTKTMPEIAAEISRTYEISKEFALKDVKAFVRKLAKFGLLETNPAP